MSNPERSSKRKAEELASASSKSKNLSSFGFRPYRKWKEDKWIDDDKL